MTPLQKATLRASEIRVKLNELGALEELSDEQSTEIDELRSEYQTVEKRIQALTVASDEPAETSTPTETTESSEDRELREMRSRVDFGNYVSVAFKQSALEGAEAEYNQHLGIATDRFPLETLADLETRAAVDGDAQRNQGSWIDRLFAGTAAMQLGVTMPSVSPGTSAYPVIGSNADPKQRGRTEAATAATISATVTEIKPTRNSVHAVYSIEDDARLPGLSEAIRRDLGNAMTEKIDRTVFLGDDGANENAADITGLTTAGITEITITQANKVKGDKVLEELAKLIDGKYAASMGDVSLVATVGSNTLWLSTVQNSAASNDTVAQFLRANGVSWTTRGEIESNTANGDFGGFIGLRRGIQNCAVAPVWESGQMILDPYSSAKSGEVQLTLHYLWGFQIPRTANFRRLKYVT